MDGRRQILVVIRTPRLADSLFRCLQEAGFGVTLVTTFTAAKVHLDASPDLVITELKLAEFNGLHLALRARAKGIPTIVIGQPDLVLEQEAEQLGASYVAASEVQPAEIVDMVQRAACSDVARAEGRVGWIDRTTLMDESMSWRGSVPEPAWAPNYRSIRRPVLH